MPVAENPCMPRLLVFCALPMISVGCNEQLPMRAEAIAYIEKRKQTAATEIIPWLPAAIHIYHHQCIEPGSA